MRRRFDVIEVGLLMALVSAVAWFGGRVWQERQPVNEGMGAEERPLLQTFEGRYGPQHNSHGPEEWIIRDFFQDRRGGTFLDVGAAYYQQDNNTYYLENRLAWKGIAIDAQPEYATGYAAHRPQTKFFAVFASDRADDSVGFLVQPSRPLEASVVHAEAGEGSRERRVPTTTLNALLDHEQVTHVDFVSMDIELGEPKALAGFDIDRFAPALVCIEVHPEVRQAILDFFQRHRYVIVGRYLPVDHMNLYFMPADRAAP